MLHDKPRYKIIPGT